MAYQWQPMASGPNALQTLSQFEKNAIDTNLRTEAVNIANTVDARYRALASIERYKANALNQINAWRQEQQRRLETAGSLALQTKLKEKEWERYGGLIEKQAAATEAVRLKTATEKYNEEVEGLGETFAIQYGDAQDDFDAVKAEADALKVQADEMKTTVANLNLMRGKRAEAATLEAKLTDLNKELKAALKAVEQRRIAALRVARDAGLKGFQILPRRGEVIHGATKKKWMFGATAKTETTDTAPSGLGWEPGPIRGLPKIPLKELLLEAQTE